MIPIKNIHPLTDFKRNTTAFRKRLKKTGQAEVLTVEGRAELVVQDAAAYQKLLEAVDHLEALHGIQEGLASIERGEGLPADQFFAELRKKLKPPAQRRAS